MRRDPDPLDQTNGRWFRALLLHGLLPALVAVAVGFGLLLTAGEAIREAVNVGCLQNHSVNLAMAGEE
ncbi:MAG TPA: hypothetical protein VD860_12225 [Azospirillum sp.]|nr:hypothetical protein [Azospirillum sp.]